MRSTPLRTATLAALAVLALTGCREDTLPTRPPDATETSFFRHPPAPGFEALARRTPLEQERVVHGTIGPLGGRLEIPEAGITFIVPAGALSHPVEITVRAHAGAVMAFDFAPHGLRFLEPATVEMRVLGTGAEARLAAASPSGDGPGRLDRFMGVYFTGEPESGVEPVETFRTYRSGDAVAFDIEHFSGYVCATG